jgi:HEAT repeat protein
VFLLLVSLAFAGVPEDLITAADDDLPTAIRREAMNRLQLPSSFADVVRAAKSSETPPARRWVAVRSLGKNPAEGTREALLELLASTDAPVRMAACASLAERKDGTVTGRVAARLTDPALLFRVAAADALAQIRDPSTLADLGRALDDPTNFHQGTSLWVRRHFVDAMTAIGTDEALPYLADALDDEDTVVSEAALAGLRRIGGVDFSQGRTPDEERTAWKRWAKARSGR